MEQDLQGQRLEDCYFLPKQLWLTDERDSKGTKIYLMLKLCCSKDPIRTGEFVGKCMTGRIILAESVNMNNPGYVDPLKYGQYAISISKGKLLSGPYKEIWLR